MGLAPQPGRKLRKSRYLLTPTGTEEGVKLWSELIAAKRLMDRTWFLPF